MGHPKLKKKTYSKPPHPWQKERIEEEVGLLKEFGLKNKREIWKVASLLRKYFAQAKKLIALATPQAEMEKAKLLKKLSSLGLIGETTKLEDILVITLKGILNRRLQTLIYKKGMAKSVRQARQFIAHRHIVIGNKKITTPSYLVTKEEEALISFAPSSSLSSQEHPERLIQEPKRAAKKEKKETRGKRGPRWERKQKAKEPREESKEVKE